VLSHFWFAPVEKKIDDTVAVFECLNDLCWQNKSFKIGLNK
jgi:hypothetical protein